MISIINTTQRVDSYSEVIAEKIAKIILADTMLVVSADVSSDGIAPDYMKGFESDAIFAIRETKKVVFVIPSYYKNVPPIFLEWLDRLSKEQFKDFDNKPILIVSIQAGLSIDSLPENIARTTICQAIKFNGYLSNISPNWIGCTKEWFEVEGNEERFKEKILDFVNNYE